MNKRFATTLGGLLVATDLIESDAFSETKLAEIVARGVFRPNENEAIGYWFARFLTIRDSLWEVINETMEAVDKPIRQIQGENEWKHFLIGYSAACLLIRIDRLLLFKIATDSVIQRKLNEEFVEFRIPRKQYTEIFSAYVNRREALKIYDAIRLARKNRKLLEGLCDDPELGFLAQQLPRLESYLDPSRRNYVGWLLAYVNHKWRRRGVVALTNLLTTVAEGFGRTASEISLQANKRVTPALCAEMSAQMQPGDVMVTRHDVALTNLFLPGFWPHASLYIGTEEQRTKLPIKMDPEKAERSREDVAVLEARKDGVLFRPLSDALSVDNFVVLRPNLSQEFISQGIERTVRHEGKMYNFDFDFFNSERLVCTEVVYRAFDGLGGMSFQLKERANRQTLSAEDLLDFALDSDWWNPIAIFGVNGCQQQIVHGEPVRELLINSYRRS